MDVSFQIIPKVLPTCGKITFWANRDLSNIRRTKSQDLNDFRLFLLLPLSNPLKPGVKLRMKM